MSCGGGGGGSKFGGVKFVAVEEGGAGVKTIPFPLGNTGNGGEFTVLNLSSAVTPRAKAKDAVLTGRPKLRPRDDVRENGDVLATPDHESGGGGFTGGEIAVLTTIERFNIVCGPT